MKGARLTLALELSTEAGEVLERWDDESPLEVTLGAGDLPEALEEALAGVGAGDEVDVVLQPEEAFGALDPERVIAVPRDQLSSEQALRKGDWLAVQVDEENGSEPDEIECRVLEIDDEAVYLDGNHPLAGQVVRFRVRVLAAAT